MCNMIQFNIALWTAICTGCKLICIMSGDNHIPTPTISITVRFLILHGSKRRGSTYFADLSIHGGQVANAQG